MRGVIVIALALCLVLMLISVPVALAGMTVWTSFDPYDWHADYAHLEHGETATAGLWINGDGYENVTHATFYWQNPHGETVREQTVNMTNESAAKSAYDSFTPYSWDGQWVVRINYYSPDIPGGAAGALPFYFYYGVTPTTPASTPTTVTIPLPTTVTITSVTATLTTSHYNPNPTPDRTDPITVLPTTTTWLTCNETGHGATVTTTELMTTMATTTTPATPMAVVLLALAGAAIALRARSR